MIPAIKDALSASLGWAGNSSCSRPSRGSSRPSGPVDRGASYRASRESQYSCSSTPSSPGRSSSHGSRRSSAPNSSPPPHSMERASSTGSVRGDAASLISRGASILFGRTSRRSSLLPTRRPSRAQIEGLDRLMRDSLRLDEGSTPMTEDEVAKKKKASRAPRAYPSHQSHPHSRLHNPLLTFAWLRARRVLART